VTKELLQIPEGLNYLKKSIRFHKDRFRLSLVIRIEPGRYQSVAHFVWNFYNPDNKVFKGDGYIIHHLDEDPLNNQIMNLVKITRGEHNSYHRRFGENNSMWGKIGPMFGKVHTEESKRKMKESAKGGYFAGKYHTEGSKKKMSVSLTGRKFSEAHKQKISESMKKALKEKRRIREFIVI